MTNDLTTTVTIHRIKLPPIGNHKARIGWQPELIMTLGDKTRSMKCSVYAYKIDAEFYAERMLDRADYDLWEAM